MLKPFKLYIIDTLLVIIAVGRKSFTLSNIYFQDVTTVRRRLQYDRSNLARACEATQAGMSVYKAARRYSVPESTLRDRTRGNVYVDARVGHATLMTAQLMKNRNLWPTLVVRRTLATDITSREFNTWPGTMLSH